MYNGTIKNCKAENAQAGAVLIDDSNMNMYGGDITNCTGGDVGGISSFDNGIINIEGGSIHNNEGYYSGAILLNDSSTLNITDSTITDNTGNYAGAIMMFSNSNATINSGIITGNNAGKYGGAVFEYHASTSLIVKSDATIWDNTARVWGDDFFVNKAKFFLEKPTAILDKELTNTDDGHMVTGWYQDDNPRWSDIHDEPDEMYLFGEEDLEQTISGVRFGLKAAHGPMINYEYVGDVPSGIDVPDEDFVNIGAKYTAKIPESVTHYEFNGWYTDEALTEKFVDGTVLDKNITLYGEWKLKSYTISYDTTGGAGDGDYVTKTVPAGDTITVEVAPTKEGYTFKGWNTSEDGSGITYNEGDKVEINGDIVFYAQWEPIEPVDPTEPTDPTEPVAPTNPTDPTEPTPTPEPQSDDVNPSDDETKSTETSKNDDSKSPKTGDKVQTIVWVCLIAASGITVSAIVAKRKHSKK